MRKKVKEMSPKCKKRLSSREVDPDDYRLDIAIQTLEKVSKKKSKKK